MHRYLSFAAAFAFLLYPSLARAAEPLRVNSGDNIVLMGYEPWFGPKGVYYGNAPHQPKLKSASTSAIGLRGYDSADEKIISQHAAWLEKAGVHAILLDHSNGTACTFGDSRFCSDKPSEVAAGKAHFGKIKDNITAIFQKFAAREVALKIVPLLGGGEPTALEPNADGITSLEKQINFYLDLFAKYPGLSVQYGGQPLFLFFTGAAQGTDENAAWRRITKLSGEKYAGKFTFRIMAGYVGQQPQLLAAEKGQAGLKEAKFPIWNWIERLKPEKGLLPAYVKSPAGQVEAFTVQLTSPPENAPGGNAGWKNADGTYHPELAPRAGGATFRAFMKYARELRPTFLVVNQWNCFCEGSDGGVDFETTNDFEPDEAGSANYDLLKKELEEYFHPPAAILGRGIYLHFSGAVYASNGQNVCSFADPATYTQLTGLTNMEMLPKLSAEGLSGVPFTGKCETSQVSEFAPAGLYRTPDGAVYNSNGYAFCSFTSPEHFAKVMGKKPDDAIPSLATTAARLRFDGPCIGANGDTKEEPAGALSAPVASGSGLFVTAQGAVYRSDGKEFCGFTDPEHFLRSSGKSEVAGTPVRTLEGTTLKYVGACP